MYVPVIWSGIGGPQSKQIIHDRFKARVKTGILFLPNLKIDVASDHIEPTLIACNSDLKNDIILSVFNPALDLPCIIYVVIDCEGWLC